MSTANPGLRIEDLLRHREWVRGVARALVFGEQDVDDLEQEAWLASLRAPGEGVASPRGWLATVMRRAASRIRGREIKRREIEKLNPRRAEADATCDVVAQAELQERVVRSVLALAEPYRKTILLRFFEDLPLAAIATRMQAPVETVRTRLRRGLAMLRSQLEATESSAWPVTLLPLVGSPGLKAAGSVASGVLLMSKSKIVAIAGVVAALSIVGWWAATGRLGSDDGRSDVQTPVLRPRAAEDQAPSADASAGVKDPEVQIRPRPSADEDATAPATSRGSGVAAVTTDAARVEGEVLSPDGNAVEGVTVLAGDPAMDPTIGDEESIRLNTHNLMEARGRVSKTITSSVGAYVFERIAPTKRLSIAAVHPELGVVAVVGLPVEAGEKRVVTLRFEPGMRFWGRVTDDAARPIAGAVIDVTGFRGPKGIGVQDREVTTDEEGNYRTASLPASGYILEAEARGHYDAQVRVMDVSPAERSRQVDFKLERAPLLRGKFLLADGSPARLSAHVAEIFGKNVPGAREGLALRASADDPRKNPNFSLLGRAPGKLVEADDSYEFIPRSKAVRFLSLWLGKDLLGLGEIEGNGKAPDIVVDWSRARRPKGRGALGLVVKSSADGAPVANYFATISGPTEADLRERGSWGHRVKSADGRFQFEKLIEGKYDLTITADGFAEHKTTVEIAPDPQVNDAVVQLVPDALSPAKASVAGVVQRSAGDPVNGATVWLVPEKKERSRDVKRGQTNSEGAFRFEKLLPEQYVVITEARGLPPAWARAFPQPSVEGLVLTVPEGVEVRLVPEGGSSPYSVRVTDAASGVAVIDDLRSGTQRFGGVLNLDLQRGRHRVQLICPNHDLAEADFEAVAGAQVRLGLTRSTK